MFYEPVKPLYVLRTRGNTVLISRSMTEACCGKQRLLGCDMRQELIELSKLAKFLHRTNDHRAPFCEGLLPNSVAWNNAP